jgi:hypothetical protein
LYTISDICIGSLNFTNKIEYSQMEQLHAILYGNHSQESYFTTAEKKEPGK